MATLICGSFAFDTIMIFPDRFRNHLLPDQIHILNVCFTAPEMRREFGGCAGNIAYNLHLLGGDARPMGTVGEDFASYRERLAALGIDHAHVVEIPNTYTAQAFITTDLDDNQITAFHPGAMSHAHVNHVREVDGVELGIVAPDGREAMLQHAREFAERGVPFVFDPGQGLAMFEGRELETFIEQARWVVVNDYESRMLLEKTGRSLKRLASRVDALIVTLGAKGSTIHASNGALDVPPVAVDRPLDPTGCGDAFRGGLLYGLARGFDWPTTGRIASLMGAIKATARGTQNHRFTPETFAERFAAEFGYRFD